MGHWCGGRRVCCYTYYFPSTFIICYPCWVTLVHSHLYNGIKTKGYNLLLLRVFLNTYRACSRAVPSCFCRAWTARGTERFKSRRSSLTIDWAFNLLPTVANRGAPPRRPPLQALLCKSVKPVLPCGPTAFLLSKICVGIRGIFYSSLARFFSCHIIPHFPSLFLAKCRELFSKLIVW